MKNRINSIIRKAYFRVLTGRQVTNDFYLMHFESIISTGVVLVLGQRIRDPITQSDATAAERDIQSVALLQSGTGQASTFLQRLISIWLMGPLVGKMGQALRLGRLHEPKTTAFLLNFRLQAQASDTNLQMHYFAVSFDVGLVSRRFVCSVTIAHSFTLDLEFDPLAASVDLLALFLNLQQLKIIDHDLLRQ